MSKKNKVYLGLGSNVGNSHALLAKAIAAISALSQVSRLRVSRFFHTEPVSPIPQRSYLNAACSFYTSLSAHLLLEALQQIEATLGKVPKPKECPRPIDLDILLFGIQYHDCAQLQIPHPRMKERLFVLIPLLDLTETILYPLNAEGSIEKLSIKKLILSLHQSQEGNSEF